MAKEPKDLKLDREDLAADPFRQFALWYDEWQKVTADPSQTPMTLATATPEGKPSIRTVLLKSWGERGFVFYTNYESRKGREVAANPNAALLFYWPELARQVRVEGTIERVTSAESDAYFETRDYGSKLGAWASRQSRIIESRENLEAMMAELKNTFPKDVPRPPFWGGYRVRPQTVEFWQGRTQRLHDRFVFHRESGLWRTARLSP